MRYEVSPTVNISICISCFKSFQKKGRMLAGFQHAMMEVVGVELPACPTLFIPSSDKRSPSGIGLHKSLMQLLTLPRLLFGLPSLLTLFPDSYDIGHPPRRLPGKYQVPFRGFLGPRFRRDLNEFLQNGDAQALTHLNNIPKLLALSP